MGLDTSHDCWHGPYSSFTRFRNELAKAAGYEVKPVTYDDGMTYDTVDIDWRRIDRDNPEAYLGVWQVPESDPLVYLIAHSDCNGVLKPEQAEPLAERLEVLVPTLREREAGAALPWVAKKAEQFAAGLRRAIAAGEDVDFH